MYSKRFVILTLSYLRSFSLALHEMEISGIGGETVEYESEDYNLTFVDESESAEKANAEAESGEESNVESDGIKHVGKVFYMFPLIFPFFT